MGRFTILLLAAALSFAGVALSAGGGSSQNVTLCADKNGGEISLGAKKGGCSKGEKKLTIAKQGPAGEVGPAGADGRDGTPADLTPEPWRNVQDPPVPTAQCPSQPGFFCINSGGPDWGSLLSEGGEDYPPVAFHKDPMGYVHLRGVLSQGGSGAYYGGVAFYLPPGYRPTDGTHRFWAQSSISDWAKWVTIGTDGAVDVNDACCPDLSGITFRP